MRAWLRIGRRTSSPEAADAVQAADLSRRTALSDRDQMAHLRVQADQAAAEARAHNTANHFDTWLQQVVREGRRS